LFVLQGKHSDENGDTESICTNDSSKYLSPSTLSEDIKYFNSIIKLTLFTETFMYWGNFSEPPFLKNIKGFLKLMHLRSKFGVQD